MKPPEKILGKWPSPAGDRGSAQPSGKKLRCQKVSPFGMVRAERPIHFGVVMLDGTGYYKQHLHALDQHGESGYCQ